MAKLQNKPLKAAPWRIVADALQNERQLDIKFRETATAFPQNIAIPNYKVMKQFALWSQLGRLYSVFIRFAPLAVLFAVPFQWMLLLVGAVGRPRIAGPKDVCWVYPTNQSNLAMINDALDSDPQTERLPRRVLQFSLRSLGTTIGWLNYFSVVRAHLHWLHFAVTSPVEERRDLLLHGQDALSLLALASIASQSEGIFVTDDHYQRWAHVLSHVAKDFRVVQHGFVDTELELPHLGGRVARLYLRELSFRSVFERYYHVGDHILFAPFTELVNTRFSRHALFLASSFPSIDDEIRLLDLIQLTRRDLPIIVKFHPAHRYDSRRYKLASYASLVFDEPGNPACRVFVSYDSFMAFDYKQFGIATVSIARAGGVEAAASEVCAYFASAVEKGGRSD